MAWMRTRTHCVGGNCEIFACRDQGCIANKAIRIISTGVTNTHDLGSKSKHARRKHSHPQYRFVWGAGKVGIPDLLELWTKLSQFRWIRTPFDSRVDSPGRYDRQLKEDERRKRRRTRMVSGPSQYFQTQQ